MWLQAFGSFPDHDYIHRDHDYLHADSHSDGPNSDTSSQASPNSRLRRSTFPVDFEGFPLQGDSSNQGSPMSQPKTPMSLPKTPQGVSPHHSSRRSGSFDGQHQKAGSFDNPLEQQESTPGLKDDGFNSDPEHSSRALRLKATHLAHSERHRSPGKGSPPRKGIRRAASEAQLLNRSNSRVGSFGSHTSDSTRSFDEYLKNHRSPTPSPRSRCAKL